jgi:ABC-type transport system substrate-binding protein
MRWLTALCLAWVVACAMPLDPPPEGSAEGGTPHPGGVLRLASSSDVNTLDPALGYDETSWLFEQMQFDTLVDYDDATNVVPELAESWTTSPDGTRWEFQVRRDVRFSTGRPMTAADVAYSLQRILTPSVHSLGAEFFQNIVGASEFIAGTAPTVRGLEAPAPDRLVVTLTAPDPLFLHKLTLPFASAVDRETVERVGQGAFARSPVGTGAFRLTAWTQGQELRLERNPNYWRPGLPYLDAIDLQIGLSGQLSWFQYQRGGLDITEVPSAEFLRVAVDPRYAPLVVRRPTVRTQYLGLNCAMPPLDRVDVRRALALAIDRERLVELVDGRGTVARGIVPPDMPGFAGYVIPMPYDPAAARRGLAAAGFPSGFSTTIWTQRDDGPMRLAQSMQQDLAAVGVTATLKPVDFPALIEAVRNPGQVPMFLLGWEADLPDPSNFLSVLLHSRGRGVNNNTFYGNTAVDALLDAAEPVTDPSRRLAMYREAEARILDEAPWVPLFHPVTVVVRHPRVRDYKVHPVRPPRLERVWLAW